MLEPIGFQSVALSDVVYDTIRKAIITRQLEPGARVVESALAKRFGVSKTPVREAILKLAEIGLIVQDGRESRIVSSSPKNIADSFQVRIVLELEALNALKQVSKEELVSLERFVTLEDDSALSDDLIEYYHDARAFHLAIPKISGNSFLLHAVTNYYDLTWILRNRDSHNAKQSVQNALEHKELATLIIDGNIDQAKKSMEEHLHDVMQDALDSIITGDDSATQ